MKHTPTKIGPPILSLLKSPLARNLIPNCEVKKIRTVVEQGKMVFSQNSKPNQSINTELTCKYFAKSFNFFKNFSRQTFACLSFLNVIIDCFSVFIHWKLNIFSFGEKSPEANKQNQTINSGQLIQKGNNYYLSVDILTECALFKTTEGKLTKEPSL